MIDLVIDHRIRLRSSDLPASVHSDLLDALTLENKEKIKSKRAGEPGWEELPDQLYLYEIDDQHTSVPRGFRRPLELTLKELEIPFRYDDRRTRKAVFRLGDKPDLSKRPWQQPAANAIIAEHDMILEAPPGSGKTVTALWVLRQIAQRSLVIVHTKDIAWQWVRRAETHLGKRYPVGLIGGGKFEPSPYMTIATVQTLWSRRFDLEEEGFFDWFGAVVLDECHHATADTFNAIFDRFSAYWRVGLSATPEKTGDFRIAESVIGPIRHKTADQELEGAGATIKPRVVQVQTRFGYGFRGAIATRKRSNYGPMTEALVDDPERNVLIAATISVFEDRHNLVLSKRLRHFDILEMILRDARAWPGPIYRLTGKQSSDERKEIEQQVVEGGPCILFSTLADEAVDIPILDAIHLPYPQKNTDLIKQQIGRGVRAYPGKKDAIVIDYADINVSVLEQQWRGRWRNIYKPRNMEITRINSAELMPAREMAEVADYVRRTYMGGRS